MTTEERKFLPKAYLPQLLFFILADEIGTNYIFNIYASLSNGSTYLETFFFIFFLLLQIVFSPIQSGYSDFYCRRKSLVISLSFSAISLIPAFLYFQHSISPLFLLFLIAIIKGVAGNNLPLAWAGIADTQNSNIRLSLGFSTSAIALGYLALIVLRDLFSDKTLAVVIFMIFVLTVFVCIRFFRDIRDKRPTDTTLNKPSLKREIRLILDNFLKSKRFRNGLMAFLFWEISFYSAHMLDVDLNIRAFKGLTMAMILGYLIWVFFLWIYRKKEDKQMIKIGYGISVVAFIPIFLFFPFVADLKMVIVSCYFFYALGAAFLAPSLFSMLSKERKTHEQGKIYGLLDSTDAIALLIASLAALIYQWLELKQIVIIFVSLIAFIASWGPYATFKKIAQKQD